MRGMILTRITPHVRTVKYATTSTTPYKLIAERTSEIDVNG